PVMSPDSSLIPHPASLPKGFMLDLHSHYLPAIDDGAKSIEDSLAMLRLAAQDGIKIVVVTPHAFIDTYKENTAGRIQENYELLSQVLRERTADEEGQPLRLPQVLLGSENFVNERFVLALEKGEPVVTLNQTSYVLLEFPLFGTFNFFDRLLSALFARGLTPIFAHPERNSQFQRDTKLLHTLVRQGVCLQLDSMSLFGSFGEEAKELAFYLLKHRLAHLMASDAHDINRRQPLLSGARALAAKTIGEINAEILVQENPARIIKGADILTLRDEATSREKSRSWLASLISRS